MTGQGELWSAGTAENLVILVKGKPVPVQETYLPGLEIVANPQAGLSAGGNWNP